MPVGETGLHCEKLPPNTLSYYLDSLGYEPRLITWKPILQPPSLKSNNTIGLFWASQYNKITYLPRSKNLYTYMTILRVPHQI